MDAETQMKLLMEHCGPGKPYELGMDTWKCGHKEIETICFKGGPRSMREFCDTYFPKHATKEFLVFQNERYTFQQIHKLMISLSDVLLNTYNIQPGDRVAVSMRNFPEWCISFLAVTCLGAIVTPLNSWWTTEELLYGLQDSGSKVIICDDERMRRVLPVIDQLTLEVLLVRANHSHDKVKHWDDLVSMDHSSTFPVVTIGHDDVAAIMYTSGTTGHPKGVVLTHRGICNQLTMAILAQLLLEAVAPDQLDEKPCAICPVPLFHVTASHHLFLSSLVPGKKLVLMPKWDPLEALKLIDREKPTAWTGVPTMVQDLLEHPEFDNYDTSSLKQIGGGGAATPVSQVTKVKKKFRGGGAQQGYGLTETNGAISSIAGDEYLEKPRSCGKPFPIVQVCVVDAETGEEMEPNSQEGGELLVKSPLVMSHYWNKPEKTSEAIIEIPGKGHGWFRTGDIARVDEEGYIYIMDRKKDIIIRGGENISCAEVESACYTNAKVHECAVFGIKEERLGEVVGLAIVPKSGVDAITADEVLETMTPHLAKFKLPQKNHIFFRKELPRGATGKILKRVVRDEINELVGAKAKL